MNNTPCSPDGGLEIHNAQISETHAPVAYLIRFEGRTARCIQFDGTVVRRHGCVIVTANRGHCEGTAVLILSIGQIVSASNRVGADAIVRPASEARAKFRTRQTDFYTEVSLTASCSSTVRSARSTSSAAVTFRTNFSKPSGVNWAPRWPATKWANCSGSTEAFCRNLNVTESRLRSIAITPTRRHTSLSAA